LRAAVGAAGDGAVVDRVYLGAGERLDAGDALGGGFVREHGRPDHVADGVDVGDAGAIAARLNGDEAAIELDPALLEANALDVAAHAGGQQAAVALQRLLLPLAVGELDLDRRAFVDALHFGAHHELDFARGESFRQLGAHLVILDGEQLIERFY